MHAGDSISIAGMRCILVDAKNISEARNRLMAIILLEKRKLEDDPIIL